MSDEDEKHGVRTEYHRLGEPGVHQSVSGSVPAELAHAIATNRVCGSCKYFEKAEGQRLMKAQKFVERLVREEHWQVKYLASPLNDLGICGAHSSGRDGAEETITGRMHAACDQYREDRGLVTIRRKTTDEK